MKMPMAPPEAWSWLTKVRSAMSSSGAGSRKQQVISTTTTLGILAFEVASLMSKLLHLWRAVGDAAALARLRHETIRLHGVRMVVSDDDDFLLGLARAELVDSLRAACAQCDSLAARCADPRLRELSVAFREMAGTGLDRHGWAAGSWKEMEARARRMEAQVATTAALRRAMEELAHAEHGLRKMLLGGGGGGGGIRRMSVAAEQQQLVFARKQEVKQLKQASLWSCTFDAAVASLARAAFTTLARINAVFGEDRSSAALTPPPGTLGAAALAPRYAEVVMWIERMARSPLLVGPEERDELYGMLTASVRAQLRARLRGCAVAASAADPALAAQWRAALGGILDWLAPMAHATLRWHADRSPEARGGATTTTVVVLLLQTLELADRDRVDAAVVELLVGLNYVCRFHHHYHMEREREMSMVMLHRQQQQQQMVVMEDTDGGNATVVVSSCA